MPTILVVEDNAIVARDLQNMLRRIGYAAPMVVASGEAAIDEAIALKPDLVLMDVGLRGPLDGIESARAIRAQLDVPIVFMTALSDDATIQRARQTEPFGYMLKPLEPRAVRTAIEIALYTHRLAVLQRERERWYTAALRAVPDAVLTVGRDQRVTFVNPAAEALLRRTREAIFGRVLADVVPLRDARGAETLEAQCAAVIASGETLTLEPGAALAREGGVAEPVTGQLTAIATGSGDSAGVVLVLRSAAATAS